MELTSTAVLAIERQRMLRDEADHDRLAAQARTTGAPSSQAQARAGRLRSVLQPRRRAPASSGSR